MDVLWFKMHGRGFLVPNCPETLSSEFTRPKPRDDVLREDGDAGSEGEERSGGAESRRERHGERRGGRVWSSERFKIAICSKAMEERALSATERLAKRLGKPNVATVRPKQSGSDLALHETTMTYQCR